MWLCIQDPGGGVSCHSTSPVEGRGGGYVRNGCSGPAVSRKASARSGRSLVRTAGAPPSQRPPRAQRMKRLTPTFSERHAQPRRRGVELLPFGGGAPGGFRGGTCHAQVGAQVCCATINHVRAPPPPSPKRPSLEHPTLQSNRTCSARTDKRGNQSQPRSRAGGGARAHRCIFSRWLDQNRACSRTGPGPWMTFRRRLALRIIPFVQNVTLSLKTTRTHERVGVRESVREQSSWMLPPGH